MKIRRFSLIGIIGFILLLAACGKDEVQPVAINEGTDTCEVCNMGVANNQHATQIVLEDGKSMVFDDIGCMYEWLGDNENAKVAAKFVRDYDNQEWIGVDDATFVYNQSIKTPMAYNVVSFKEKATADKFVTDNEGSTLMTPEELAQHEWERNNDMMQQMKMEHGSHSEGEMNHGDMSNSEEGEMNHGEVSNSEEGEMNHSEGSH